MTTLGQAYVQIMPSAKGISGSIQKTLNPEATRAGKSAGGRIVDGISKSMGSLGSTLTKTITAPVATLGTVLAGIAGKKGFDRLLAIDTAQAKLEALGHDAKNVDLIMESALASVKGTAFGLGDAATASASAVAAGIKPGKELTQYLTNVGDAAAIAGLEYMDMGSICNKSQAGGKATRMELNQMADRGLPVFQWLAEAANETEDAIQEMVTNGAISSELFNKAIEQNIGGAAQIMGAKSFSAALDNVWAAVGRVGASFLDGQGDGKGFFSQLKPLMADFTGMIDNMGDKAQDLGVKFGEAFSKAIEKVGEAINWWTNLDGSTHRFILNMAGIARAAGPVLVVLSKIIGVITTVATAIASITPPVLAVIAVIGGLVAIGITLYKNWDTIKAKAIEVFSHFTPLLDVVKAAFQNLMDSVGPILESLKTLWQSLVPLLEKIGVIVGAVLVVAFWVLIGVFNGVVAAIGPIINAFINLVDFAVNMVNAIVALFMGDFAGAWQFLQDAAQSSVDFFVNLFTGLIDFVLGFVDAIVGFFQGLYMMLVGNSIIPDMVNGIVDWFKNLGKWDVDLVKKLVDGVIAGFNFMVNSVKSVINTFKSIISTGLNYVKNTFSNILAFLKGLVTGDFGAMRDAVFNQINNIKNTISNIFGSLPSIVTGAFSRVKNAVSNGIKGAYDAVANMAKNFFNAGKNIAGSIADGIKGAIGKVTGAIKNVTQKIRDFLPFSPPKTGPLIDIMDVEWGATIGAGIEGGEKEVAKAMDNMLDFDLTKKATFSNPNQTHINQDNYGSTKQDQPIILQVDGKTFAQIIGDYTSQEGGKRIRRIERGLA